MNTSFKDNFHVLEDGNYVYTAGSRVIVYNPETRGQQSYLAADGPDISITSFSATTTKSGIISCGIYSGGKAYIQIFDYPSMKKRKPLFFRSEEENRVRTDTFIDSLQEVVSISISPTGKYLATVQAVDWSLNYWSIDKAKIVASAKTANNADQQVHQISICSYDDMKMIVLGNNLIKTFKWSDGQLKGQVVQTRGENKNYNCVAWYSADRAFIGSDNGKVVVLDNGVVQAELQIATDKVVNIHGVCIFSKGLICAGQSGQLAILERQSTGDSYATVKCATITDDDNIRECTSLLLSQNEETIFFTTADKQTFSIGFGTVDSFKDEEVKISQPLPAFHTGKIVHSETSSWKPYMVTLGDDNSVRIWNTLDNSCELTKSFTDPIVSVSIHFMGTYLAVVFKEKIQILAILMDDLKLIHEINSKGASLVKFCRGGHLYAVVQGNNILVYNTWTHENVSVLHGHRSKVSSITWDPMDYRLISAGEDGAIYEWSMISMKREIEHITKSAGYKIAINGHKLESIIAVSLENVVQLIDKDGTDELLHDTPVSSICMGAQTSRLYVGTDRGSIKVLDLASLKSGVIEEYFVSTHAIVNICNSSDSKSLLASGADGSITAIELQLHDLSIQEDVNIYIEEVLISKTDLEQKTNKINELKSHAEEVKLENEYQLHIKELGYQEKLKEINEKHDVEKLALEKHQEVLKSQIEEEIKQFNTEKLKIEDKYAMEAQEVEILFNERLNIEIQKQAEAREHLKALEASWKKQIDDIEEKFMKEKSSKERDFEQNLKVKGEEIQRLTEELRKQSKEYEELTKEIEEDTDELIAKMRVKYETKLKEERENGLKIKAENLTMKKKHASLVIGIEQQNSEIQKLMVEEKKLQSTMRTLEKDIQGLKKEIQERDEAIQDKEKRIEDLKKKNQELEKFKFVLVYKMKELKHQVEPREQEIQVLIKQIKEMDVELEQYHQINNSMELKAEDLKQRVSAGEAEVKKQREELEKANIAYNQFHRDLSECMSLMFDQKAFKNSLKALYQKYCLEKATDNQEKKVVKLELSKQRQHLEKNLNSIREKLDRTKEKHKQENAKIIKENMLLISSLMFIFTVHRIMPAASANDSRAHNDAVNIIRDHSLEKFRFLGKDIDKLRNKLIDKEGLIRDLRQSLLAAQRNADKLKAEREVVPALPIDHGDVGEKEEARIDKPEFPHIFTFASDETMPCLRNLAGSIHQHREDNYVNVPGITVFAVSLKKKFQEEVSFWHNVELYDVVNYLHLNLDLDGISTRLDKVLPFVFSELSRKHSSLVYLDCSFTMDTSEIMKKVKDSLLEAGGLVVTKNETTVAAGVVSSSEAYKTLVQSNLDCMKKKSPCQLETISAYEKPFTYFVTNSQANYYFCYINVRSDLMYVDMLLDPIKISNDSDHKIIALGVPTTGHGLKAPAESRLLSVFLPNLVKSITPEECNSFKFYVYVGYDSGDLIWDDPGNLETLRTLIEPIVADKASCISMVYVKIPFSNAWLSHIWNRLYIASLKDGAHYYYQVNDDLEIVDSGWASNFTATLDSNHGVGVVGPYDPRWNCTLLTQAMVTKKHYDRYGLFYPFEIKDWYTDFWITRIYTPGNMFCSEDYKANNIKDQGIRYEWCNRPKWNEAVQRDKYVTSPDAQ